MKNTNDNIIGNMFLTKRAFRLIGSTILATSPVSKIQSDELYCKMCHLKAPKAIFYSCQLHFKGNTFS